MKILVITPTLNRSPYLDETIASVRNCAPDAEHILSAPSSEVEALRARYPELQVVADQGREGGMYGAINAGIESAESDWEWFCYVNDDDHICESFYKMIQFGDSSDFDLVYGKVDYINKNGDYLADSPYCPFSSLIPYLLYDGIVPFVQVGMAFRRKLVESLAGFDANTYRYTGDLDFICRAVASGAKIVAFRKFVAEFRILETQLSANDDAMGQEHQLAINRFQQSQERLPLSRVLARIAYYLTNIKLYCIRIIKFRSLRSRGMANNIR